MPQFMRPANREEALKFFNESPHNLSIMINDGNGDYVSRRSFEETINKYRTTLYEIQDENEALHNKIKDLIDETYKDIPVKV
jgi:hypothetical protein